MIKIKLTDQINSVITISEIRCLFVRVRFKHIDKFICL